MRNITKAFFLTLLIYALIIVSAYLAYQFFMKESGQSKFKVDPSTIHLKTLEQKPKGKPSVSQEPKTVQSIKRPDMKRSKPHTLAQAQMRSISEKKEVSEPDPLVESILSKLPASVEQKTAVDPKETILKELYGGDYELLSSKAKKYLKDNYKVMQAVTQDVLNRIGRVYIDPSFYYYDYNLIEFMLYPDGSISDIKMLKNAGFDLLNKITKETIETAFKDYPPTEEPLLIRYKFLYDLRSF